jgi:hypothetical protein
MSKFTMYDIQIFDGKWIVKRLSFLGLIISVRILNRRTFQISNFQVEYVRGKWPIK